MSGEVLLSAHLVATLLMVGLIWFVQVVHYPLFGAVGDERFVAYELEHQRRTAWVVGPPMAVEGVTAILIVVTLREELGLALPLIALVVLGVVHLSTVFLQVPAHGTLADGYAPDVAARLVRTNWIRTVGWSLRGVLALAMMLEL